MSRKGLLRAMVIGALSLLWPCKLPLQLLLRDPLRAAPMRDTCYTEVDVAALSEQAASLLGSPRARLAGQQHLGSAQHRYASHINANN
ncbi:unnamed protein product [Bubo scandiacus]